jgi:hypothetical protein
VERVVRADPATDDADVPVCGCMTGILRTGGEGVPKEPDLALNMGFPAESIVFLLCGGAETRREAAREGMEVDMRFAALDGSGTGVALGERFVLEEDCKLGPIWTKQDARY